LVEQSVPLFDGLLILRILPVRPTRLDHVPDLVDFSVDASRGDEARQLLVQQRQGHAERARHGGHEHAAVGLEELRVGQDAVLAQDVGAVGAQVAVVTDARENREKLFTAQ